MADVVVDADNKNPKQLLGQGIKAYILQDYDASVAALSKASELLALEHADDLHDSLGEVYLYYGKALLGLSREESNVLGDAIPKEAEDSDEEEAVAKTDERTENPDEKMEENAESADEKAESADVKAASADEKAESADDKIDTSDENINEVVESTDEKAENEDEASDLQVAWEVLELAKKIYVRQGDNGKRHLAETLIVLGEISLESENFSAAIEDIKQGLEIQKTLFEKDSRKIAETYYKLGIAYSTDSQIEEAIQSFNGSLEYLKYRVANLEQKDDKKDEIQEEIKEIRSLIPDIEEKIADMKSYRDEALKQLVSAVIKPKIGEGSTTTNSSGASSSNTVNDISHLVKKKRKIDEVTEEKGEQEKNPAKKSAN